MKEVYLTDQFFQVNCTATAGTDTTRITHTTTTTHTVPTSLITTTMAKNEA